MLKQTLLSFFLSDLFCSILLCLLSNLFRLTPFFESQSTLFHFFFLFLLFSFCLSTLTTLKQYVLLLIIMMMMMMRSYYMIRDRIVVKTFHSLASASSSSSSLTTTYNGCADLGEVASGIRGTGGGGAWACLQKI